MLLQSDEFRRSQGPQLRIIELKDGLRAAVDPTDSEFGTHVAQTGGWEDHVAAAIRANLSPGGTFVDIGANLGLMSFAAAQVVGPTGKV
jgi:hypothetical protein